VNSRAAREALLRIAAPGYGTAEIQESHQAIYHHLCREIEIHFFIE